MTKNRISFCSKVMSFMAIIFLLTPIALTNSYPTQTQYTQPEIDKAWITVPWSHGGHYYHNTLTRDDQDETPNCLKR